MSISLGSTGIGSLYLGSTKIAEAYLGSTKVYGASAFSPYTVRFQFVDTSYVPTAGTTSVNGTWTDIDSSNGIWDWTYVSNDWSEQFRDKLSNSNKCDILGANGQGVTKTDRMFYNDQNGLRYISNMDLRNVTSASAMFYLCSGMQSVDNIDLRSVSSANALFSFCSALSSITDLNLGRPTTLAGAFRGTAIQTGVSVDTSLAVNTTTMYQDCTRLTSVPALDLSSSQELFQMFSGCTALNVIPSLTLPSTCDSVWSLFDGCTLLPNSAYSIYTSLYSANVYDSTQAFKNCGSNSGSSQLSNIYKTWGGTMEGTALSIGSKLTSPASIWKLNSSSQSAIPWEGNFKLYSNNSLSTQTTPTFTKSDSYLYNFSTTNTYTIRPAFFQFSSGTSGALSFARWATGSVANMTTSSSSATCYNELILDPDYRGSKFCLYRYYTGFYEGSYDPNKSIYFGFLFYRSTSQQVLTDYGLQKNSYLKSSPQLYWTL